MARAVPAHADEKQACVIAYEQGQRLRKDGKLRAAKEQLSSCSRESCPAVLRPDCLQWLAENERSLPSVVVEVYGADGKAISDVRVLVDQELVAVSVDGKPLPIDPGTHTLRFESRGVTSLEEVVVLREGEKNRPIVVRFGPKEAPVRIPDRPPAAPAPIPVVSSRGAEQVSLAPSPFVYGLGGVGLLGLAGWAYFGLSGVAAKSDLDACKPDCDADAIASARTKLHVADASLLVGLGSLGAALYFYLRSNHDTGAQRAVSPQVDVHLAPRASGGDATMIVRF
jgi:hypothetical protein